MKEINFVQTTIDNFNKKSAHDSHNLYFITDNSNENELYLGDKRVGSAFIEVTDQNPLPVVGKTGYFYIDLRNGSFSIKVWNATNRVYMVLPLADNTYIKSISRQDDSIVGTKGTGTTDEAALDTRLTNSDIASLFD